VSPDTAQPPQVASTRQAGANVAAAAGMRERILRATLELIATDGLDAVTNRRVAAAAKVSLGSLTYHFASQTDLLRESLLLYVDEETGKREQLASEIATRNPTLEEVTREIEQLAAADIPHQIAELELHLHAVRDPRLRDASRRCFAAHEGIVVAALTSLGVSEGERFASTVVALMTGLAVRRLADGAPDAQGTSEALLALMRGLAT
jgi:DNA-binding transcriptional regulator YbjK